MNHARPQPRHRVFILEDHAVVREGLVRLIADEPDLEVCGQAASTPEALQQIGGCRAEIALVDLSLKDGSGLEFISILRERQPELPVLVLSMHDETLHAERALRAGARGYIMKQEAPEQLMSALRQVLGGDIYLSPAMSNRLLSRLVDGKARMDRSPLERLTDREFEIYGLIGEALTPSEIAPRLGLSVKTVEAHRENIKHKLGVKTAAQLLHHAAQGMHRP